MDTRGRLAYPNAQGGELQSFQHNITRNTNRYIHIGKWELVREEIINALSFRIQRHRAHDLGPPLTNLD